MTLTGQVRMTYPLLRRLNYGTFTRRGMAIIVVIEATLVLASVTTTGLGNAATWLACAVGIFPIYEFLIRRSWLRVRHLTDQPWHYEVSDVHVSVTTPATHVVVAWAEISKARTARHAWYFRTASSRARVTVPRSAFSPDAQSEIDALVAAHAAPSRAR